MKISNILKYLWIMTIICVISSQSVSASLKDIGGETCILHDDLLYTNVFLISYGFSSHIEMANIGGLSICFKKNVDLIIEYDSGFLFLRWPRLKAWNSTGLIEDFTFYYIGIVVKNFTGVIIYRNGIFRELWNLYGYCSVLKIHTPHY